MTISFLIGKILGSLFAPTSLLFLWAFAAAIFCRGRRLLAVLVPFSLLLFLGVGPVADWLIMPLEQRFAPPEPDVIAKSNLGAIIVLGGGLDPERSALYRQYELTESGDRVMAAALLAAHWPTIPVVISGGSGNPLQQQEREADYIGALLRQWGIKRDQLVIENQSHNTAEHPAAIANRLAARLKTYVPQPTKSYLLVTSAAHMPRAVGVFRQAGWSVIPYPVDYRALPGWHFTIGDGLGRGWARTDQAFREWLGLLAYFMTGKTAHFLPETNLGKGHD